VCGGGGGLACEAGDFLPLTPHTNPQRDKKQRANVTAATKTETKARKTNLATCKSGFCYGFALHRSVMALHEAESRRLELTVARRAIPTPITTDTPRAP
jgi:hypothetical protein